MSYIIQYVFVFHTTCVTFVTAGRVGYRTSSGSGKIHRVWVKD